MRFFYPEQEQIRPQHRKSPAAQGLLAMEGQVRRKSPWATILWMGPRIGKCSFEFDSPLSMHCRRL
ncbi:hypothetical protein B7486_00435 [cyanobacterium TDX16]|nr:hypothetical protein B7486_00435 [cyanobacterium TDX16]